MRGARDGDEHNGSPRSSRLNLLPNYRQEACHDDDAAPSRSSLLARRRDPADPRERSSTPNGCAASMSALYWSTLRARQPIVGQIVLVAANVVAH
jgi:hypothetical protein